MRNLSISDIAGMTRDEAESAIRSRLQTITFGDGIVLSRVLGGPKMFLSTRDLGLGCHLMMDGFWEMWLTLFFSKIVKPNMTVIDVGANFGYYTLLFGQALLGTGRIIALEPVPETAAMLTRSIALNGFSGCTKIVEAAASNVNGEKVAMLLVDDEPKNAHMVKAGSPGSFSVHSVTIDALTQECDRVDLIKIDAEGAEELIFDGMKETISRFHPAILLEFNAMRYASPASFLNKLKVHYPKLQKVNFDGNLESISFAELNGDKSGEDVLLYLDEKAAEG